MTVAHYHLFAADWIVVWRDADTLAHVKARDASADRGNCAGHFVTDHQRVRRRGKGVTVLQHSNIRAANGCAHRTEEDLAVGDLRSRQFFDAKVYLDLHVRVKAEWREDEGTLNDIGLK